jgi:hypothetical protein
MKRPPRWRQISPVTKPLRHILLVLGLLATPAAAEPTPVAATFRSGLIFVTAEAGGARGLFLLDTGAAASVLDPRFAAAAGAALGRRRQIEGRGGEVGARDAAPIRIRLGDGADAVVSPVVTDLSDASRAMGTPLAGILGDDFLRRYVLLLDYRDQTVSLADAMAPPVDAVPIRMAQTPYIRARALLGPRAAEGEFQIDTGSNTAIEFWRPFADRWLAGAHRERDVGLGVAGEAATERGQIDALDVAGRRIPAPQVNFADDTEPAADAGPRYAGVIGGPAWGGLTLVLDMPDQLAWVR